MSLLGFVTNFYKSLNKFIKLLLSLSYCLSCTKQNIKVIHLSYIVHVKPIKDNLIESFIF